MHALSGITLSDQLESYQKRELRIIYGNQIKGKNLVFRPSF